MNEAALQKLKSLKTFIFDIDGVLTTGNVLVTEEGHMLRSVNIKDGFALQHAVKQGYNIAIISGGNSQGMLHRFQGLGIKEIYLGQKNKMAAFEKVCSDFGVGQHEVAYVGDDMQLQTYKKFVSWFLQCPVDRVVPGFCWKQP
jgi:3-deoxy-D-manno-octulosonate 8-phosphate phosphatase (KDO 8-P phosphatase)